MPLITIENGALFIPGDKSRKNVLKDINWTIESFEHSLIIGPNGSGKSTFLSLLAGQLWLTKGTIQWYYKGNWEKSPIIGQEICRLISPAYIYKIRKQNWSITGKDLIYNTKSNEPKSSSLNNLFEKTGFPQDLGIENLLNTTLSGMSLGQLKLTVFLQAILSNPKILLLDEFLENLDQEKRKIINILLGKIIKNTTLILTSHRSTSHISWIKKTYGITDGKLFLMNLSQANHKNPEVGPLKYSQKPNLAIQKLQICQNENQTHKICELKNVSVYIDRHPVLKNIDWIIMSGENWRISGRNGSGKTTLLKLLAKWEYPASDGSIDFWTQEGEKIETRGHHNSLFSLVSDFCEEIYDYDVTAGDLVLSGIDNSIGKYRDYSVQERYRAEQLIAHFFKSSFTASAPENYPLFTTSIRKLSTGQLRKLFLARSLINQPKVLLLDEPCSGLDQSSRIDFIQNLEHLTSIGINLVQNSCAYDKFIGWNIKLSSKFNIYKPQIIIVSHFDEDIPSTVTKEAYMQDGYLNVV